MFDILDFSFLTKKSTLSRVKGALGIIFLYFGVSVDCVKKYKL